jgi:FkbM family methyltransferase
MQPETLEEYWACVKRLEIEAFGACTPPRTDYIALKREWLSRPDFLDHLPGDWAAELDVATGAYEKYFKIGPGQVVVDAGAHIGCFTQVASERVGPSGRVYAIEPWARNGRKILSRNLSNAVLFSAAGWSSSGFELTLNVTLSSSMLSSVLRNNPFSQNINVLSLAIDDLGLPELDFLKVDVEGAEGELLKGAKQTILRCSPKIVVEVEPRQGPEILTFLQEVDYKVVGVQRLLTKEPEELSDQNINLVGLWHCERS